MSNFFFIENILPPLWSLYVRDEGMLDYGQKSKKSRPLKDRIGIVGSKESTLQNHIKDKSGPR